ncbi:retinal maintenance-domain-containing protein [Pelagophyceae sp. CCMP2097]|nr:retinal maintenance-domain-containing protein [Pelagophyceae sp. CCMP2097]
MGCGQSTGARHGAAAAAAIGPDSPHAIARPIAAAPGAAPGAAPSAAEPAARAPEAAAAPLEAAPAASPAAVAAAGAVAARAVAAATAAASPAPTAPPPPPTPAVDYDEVPVGASRNGPQPSEYPDKRDDSFRASPGAARAAAARDDAAPTPRRDVARAAAAAAPTDAARPDGDAWDSVHESTDASPAAARDARPPVDAATPGSRDAEPDDAVSRPLCKLGIGGSAFDGRCASLHCTSCNFAVRRFAAHRWHGTADYVFFRNFAGHSYDIQRLRGMLVPAAGGAAYCCQCAWQSAEAWKDLDQWGSPPGDEGGAGNGELRWKKATVKSALSKVA